MEIYIKPSIISPLQTLVSKSRVCGIRRARLAVCPPDCPVLPRILESLSLDRCSPYKKAKKLRSQADRGGGFLGGRHLGSKFLRAFRGALFPNLQKKDNPNFLDRNNSPTAHEDFALLNAAKDALLHSMFRLRYEMHLASKENPQECGSQ